MVEVDITTILLPSILSSIVAFVLVAMNRFSKTSENTITGTIKLENVKGDIDEVKDTMNKGFEKLEALVMAKDDEMRKQFSKTWDRIESISTQVSLHEYRLNQRDLERKNTSGPDKSIASEDGK